MLKVTCDQMQAIDNYTIEKIGIPSIVLMENAAIQVVNNINLKENSSFTFVCGVGNNGGDGLAIARHLINKNKDVNLFIVGDLNHASVDFIINLNILQNMNFAYTLLNNEDHLSLLKNTLIKNDLTIDAIFGIGLDRNLSGIFYKAVKYINVYSKNTLAIDISSGLHGDTKEVMKIAVKANKTITFHLRKKGLDNKEYSGQVLVVDIGIPDFVNKLFI